MPADFAVLGYFTEDLRVRFGETDRFGYMWHGWVLAYFERARANIAREFDLTPTHLLEFDLTVPMVDLAVSYKNLAFDDQELVVQATLLKHRFPLPFLDFHYRIVNLDGAEVAKGRTKQVLMSTKGKISTRIPREVRDRMNKVFAHLDDCPRWDGDYVAAIVEGR